MTDEKHLLKQLIFHYENDFMNAENLDNWDEMKKNFNTLIIGVTRYILDIRYCDNEICICSPEINIKIVYAFLEDYLKNTERTFYPIPYKTIEKIIGDKK